jgi:RHS repeat-associated protein
MPEELTDADGNIVWRARYATWGKLVFENVTGSAPDGFEQNLRMQGQYHDRETGLYYNTFRYYDCYTGRFTTEDPIGLLGGINLYQYAPNPLSWIDPWGWAKKSGESCGETSHTARGRHAHKNYANTLGDESYKFNRQIEGSKLRPDAISEKLKIVRELKPDTPRGIQRGKSQLQRYIKELQEATDEIWTGILDLYKK